MVLPIRVLPLDGIDDAAQFRLYRDGPHLEQPLGFRVKWLQFLESDLPIVVGRSRIGGEFPGLHALDRDRKSVVSGKSVYVCVYPGGSRVIRKNNKRTIQYVRKH